MANCCSYELHIRGEGLEEMKKALQENASGEFYRDMKYPMHRVAYGYMEVNEAVDINGEPMLIVNGDCAWSIGSSFMEGGYYFHHSHLGLGNIYEKLFKFNELCRKFRCEAEAWSEETGNCFAEHYFFDNKGHYHYDVGNLMEEQDKETEEWHYTEKPEGFFEFEF